MNEEKSGHLLIIGGAEDKKGDCTILKEACNMLSDGDILTILATATQHPREVGEEYRNIFTKLGLRRIQVLDVNTRDDANSPSVLDLLSESKCIFFTGGDQLRITSILGGTSCYDAIKEVYCRGGLIVGTSAGASAMSSTMIVTGDDQEPAKKCTLKMAPGLDLLNGVMIDQHFDQRGRFGRLLTGVAENPGILGIGIDEDTAIKVFPDKSFEIIGSNTVTILDGTDIQSSNVSELEQNEMLAIIGVTVHTLPKNYCFDLKSRKVRRSESGK